MTERWALLYDADCGFCRWALGKVLAWDRARRIRPVALQSDEAAKLLPRMSRRKRMSSWHLVAPSGRTWSAGDAVAPLVRLLPYGAPVARLAEAVPWAPRMLYRVAAANRGRLGKLISPPRGADRDQARKDRLERRRSG